MSSSPIAMLMLSETYDCGLFAFAAALVLGQNPGHFLFYQVEMRIHLSETREYMLACTDD